MFRFAVLALAVCVPTITVFAQKLHQSEDVVPLFDGDTRLEPALQSETADALITRIGDRVRDRHAREAEFQAYDHYLSWYWQERTFAIEIADRVAKGGSDITVTIRSLVGLNGPNFRCFFRGDGTVAEYHHNVVAKQISPRLYTTTITRNLRAGRELRAGDQMEFEFSSFLDSPQNGRAAYYGTALLYVVGQGIVPWQGIGDSLDSRPLPQSARLGGFTTLSYQYSNEPAERFKQLAGNISPTSVQKFMLGRRLHHTDFGNGQHSEGQNATFAEQAGKLGPGYVARSCVACHVNNGRAALPKPGMPLPQSVIKIGLDSTGTRHPQLGSALQTRSTAGAAEAHAFVDRLETIAGEYADGTPFTLKRPHYRFERIDPRFYSVRQPPQLVGMGLLEAIKESDVQALADPDDANGDGISGRLHIVEDLETGQLRMGRFGYKAAQPQVRHQIANALVNDMGVTNAIYPRHDDNGDTSEGAAGPELGVAELTHLTRYVSTLGVSAQRPLSRAAQAGARLFKQIGCAACHTPEFTTTPYHPLAELREQTIRPYTDLLLHDMGPELADSLGEGQASGAEWRTAPLWSIGLTKGVTGEESYLHDGRATSLEEAILWHGGEGKQSREQFRMLPADQRAALIAFLKTL